MPWPKEEAKTKLYSRVCCIGNVIDDCVADTFEFIWVVDVDINCQWPVAEE